MLEVNVMLFVTSIVLLILPSYTRAQAPDNRCYLENGGSAESLFVGEDIPVGSLIGSLKISGNASEFGNISLRLKELDSPVAIVPFSKNLSLTHPLDKEGKNGPASVFVSVICERKRTRDPNFVIPVTIRVVDVNDNAPQFINAPYSLNASEVTVVGTKVLQGIRAIDADQQGPFATVQYSVLPDKHSEYFEFANDLEGTLVLVKALDYETVSTFTITVRAQDQGNPPLYSDAKVHVNVIDADDQNPKFSDDAYYVTLSNNEIQGEKLKISPRNIFAFDQDTGIKAPIYYLFNSDNSEYDYFDIDKESGHVFVKKHIPDEELLQPFVLVIKAVQRDNADRYALSTLTVSTLETSSYDLQFLHNYYSVAVLENSPVNSVVLTVTTNRPRSKKLQFWLNNYHDILNITSDGDIVLLKSLDYETMDNYAFLVFATNTFINASAAINITVLNVNDWDPRFRYPQYEFFIADAALYQLVPGTVIGNVEAADGDRGDSITLSLRGSHAKLFTINDFGQLMIQQLLAVNTTTIHLVAVATDNGVPPRQASVPVIVHLPEEMVSLSNYWIPRNANKFFKILAFTLLSILVVAFLIVMLVYIQKHKTPSHRSNNCRTFTSFFASSGKEVSSFGKMENPVFNNNNNNADLQNMLQSSSSLQTATIKRTSSHGCLTKNKSQHVLTPSHTSKVIPAPPQVPRLTHIANSEISDDDDDHRMNLGPEDEHHFWRSADSLSSTRITKINCYNEFGSLYKRTRMDPDVSVTPLVNEAFNLEHLNLTVYF